MRSACIVPALVPLLISSLTAQTPPRSAVFLGAGFEAIGVGAPYERAYGLSLQAGYVRQYTRLGLRFGVTYFERNRELPNFSARPRAIGATIEASYDLTTSRFRPYVIAGAGIYRLSGTRAQAGTVTVVDKTSGTLLAGLGFRYRVGAVDLFTETRIHGLANGRPGWGQAFMPVTVGVRF